MFYKFKLFICKFKFKKFKTNLILIILFDDNYWKNRWIIAYNLGHIQPFLPYISDLGVLTPEASIFSLLMNFGSLQLILFAIIRFEAIKTCINENKIRSQDIKQQLFLWNRRSFVSGLCMATGLAIAANFRDSEGPIVQTMHSIGAYFLFVSSVFEVYFGSKLAFCQSLDSTGRFRSFQCLLAFILTLVFLPSYTLSFDLYPIARIDTNARLMWNSSQEGYCFHIISSIDEWLLVINLSVYYFSYVSQFRHFSFNRQMIVMKGFNQI